MTPTEIYHLLQRACMALEARGEFAIAAFVGHCMSMMTDRFGVGRDHKDQE